MARNFRRHRVSHPIADLNVTNLIDLGFMLLIIFMLVANPALQKEQKMDMNLPVASASPQQPPDPTQRTESITILPNGNVLLGESPLTLRQLSVKLAAFGKEPKPPIIELRMDAKTTAQQIVSVLDELKKNNLSKMAIPTQLAK
jgi:biopolymer transport protein TolR